MPPCLLLALALLGTASASHPVHDSPKVAEPVLEMPEEADARCPLMNETRALRVHQLSGTTTFRYIVVTKPQTFNNAQRLCARCYGGRLASIHNYHTNVQLQLQVRLKTNCGQFWIGAITQPVGKTVWCHWTDRSPWDFTHWVPGFPLYTHHYCTSFCTQGGRWRSLRCRVQLPYVCEY